MSLVLDAVRKPEEAIREACDALIAGGVVIIPTETVYGVAALPTCKNAVKNIFERKKRSDDQACAVLVSNKAQSMNLVFPSENFDLLSSNFWPGPLTLVTERFSGLGYYLGGDKNFIGVRCPDHPLVQALAKNVGPLATTSANRSGSSTPTDALEACEALGGDILTLDGGPCLGEPSTVVNLTPGKVCVIREGALSIEELVSAGLKLEGR